MGAARVAHQDSSNILTSIGPYRVDKLLGRGASGDVYKAIDVRLKRPVAVKVLATQLSRDENFIQRFTAEAEAIAQLHHPNIVQIYFNGEENGLYYFAMQYVDGQSLADLLNAKNSLPPEQAVRIMLQVLDGLSAAHEMGMVHRDIKPANILLSKSGQVFIADFGLVKAQGASQTMTGVILGTPDYLAPEQAAGQTVDARTDLYSVGAVLYRMLSGKSPFEADNAHGIIYQHLHQPPAPITSVCHVPTQLAAIVHRLLNKIPRDRFQSAADVRNELSGMLVVTFENNERHTNGVDIARGKQINARADTNAVDWIDYAAISCASTMGWSQRASQWMRSLLRHLPAVVQPEENTQYLADDAIREYQERCSDLRHLIDQSEQMCVELEGLVSQSNKALLEARRRLNSGGDANAVRKALAKEASSKKEVDELTQHARDQNEQLSILRGQYADANSTLKTLQSQKEMLLARLNAARAKSGFSSVPGRKRLLKLWAAIGLGTAVLLFLTISLMNSDRRTLPDLKASMQSPHSTRGAATDTESTASTGEASVIVYDNGTRLRNSIGMEFVTIPPGEFMMGSPVREVGRDPDERQHFVRITQPFFMSIHEVTRGQFEQFVTETGYKTNAETDGKGGYGSVPGVGGGYEKRFTWRDSGFEQTNDHPVGNVTWYDAMAFVRWLMEKENVLYRLPTEAEAEYACRAGGQTIYQTGTNASELVKVANVLDFTLRNEEITKYHHFSTLPSNAGSDGFIFTAPVGSLATNAFGLHDMIGNVEEWCSDWFDHDYFNHSPVNDPTGPETGVFRSFRGGSWCSIVSHTRCANRSRYEPDYRANFIGFRVVRNFTSDTVVANPGAAASY